MRTVLALACILTAAALVRLLCDVVARNGNLLIGVGPDASGTVPDVQAAPLRGLGDWMRVHGAVIRAGRPWFDGPPLSERGAPRYLVVDGSVHALVDATDAPTVRLEGLRPGSCTSAHLLPEGGGLEVGHDGDAPAIRLPERRPDEPVHVIRLGPGAQAT